MSLGFVPFYEQSIVILNKNINWLGNEDTKQYHRKEQ